MHLYTTILINFYDTRTHTVQSINDKICVFWMKLHNVELHSSRPIFCSIMSMRFCILVVAVVVIAAIWRSVDMTFDFKQYLTIIFQWWRRRKKRKKHTQQTMKLEHSYGHIVQSILLNTIRLYSTVKRFIPFAYFIVVVVGGVACITTHELIEKCKCADKVWNAVVAKTSVYHSSFKWCNYRSTRFTLFA